MFHHSSDSIIYHLNKTLGYGSDNGSQNSITKSGINTRNISITDEAKQQQTGKTAEETIAQIHTTTTTETATEHTGRLKNNFDKDKVQSELDAQREVTQEFSKNVQEANSEINQHLDNLKDKLKKGQISQTDYDKQVANWQRGKVLFNMLASGLSAPTQSIAGIAAATASPAVSYQIGQYFKGNAELNKIDGGKRPEEGSKEHIALHTLNGILTGAAAGNNIILSGLASGGVEIIAPTLAKTLYGKQPKDLNADEKNTISSLTAVFGAAVGSVSGNVSDAVQGSINAQNSVGNNLHLKIGQRVVKNSELKACKGNFTCELGVEKKWENIAIQNQKKLYAACDKGISTSTCADLRSQIDTSTYAGRKDYNYPTGMQFTSEVGAMVGLGLQANV